MLEIHMATKSTPLAAPSDGADVIRGTEADDVIDALAGDDKVRALGGDDEVLGGAGNDELFGGDGDDLLVGNTGNDTMVGNRGNDRMVWNNGDGTDVMEGGRGHDVAEVNGSDTAGDEFTIGANGDRVVFDRVNFGQFGLDIGTTERLEVNGLGGDDIITGAEGLDGLIKLALDGGAGNDTITGGDGDDVLWGGWGNDLLVGFRGDDRMLGGAGNDRMVWNNGDGTDVMEGGGGWDVAEVNGSDTAGDEVTIAANGDRVDFDRVNFGQFGLDIGTTERLEVNGQGGDDIIAGGEGLDGLIKLALDGGAGKDSITGGDGDDGLYGGWGDDLLVGFRGDDRMLGGAGNDRMVWNNGDGTDVMEGGGGWDVAEVNGSDTAGDVFTITANGDRVDFDRVNFGQFSIDIGTTERLEVNGLSGDDKILADDGLAGVIKLVLDGGAGNDGIRGGDGDDRLYGGDGDDTLVGDDAASEDAVGGDDVMTGGAGADTFVFDAGSDVITDFENGVDKIVLKNLGVDSFEDFAKLGGQVGDDVVIDFGERVLTIENVDAADIDATDFLF
jgi:Ca2+-binding RTX toxin-like protein